MKQGFVLWNSSYADPENRSRRNPSGGLRPALIEPPAPHDVPLSKRRPTKNRAFHLLFRPDILMCYQHSVELQRSDSTKHSYLES